MNRTFGQMALAISNLAILTTCPVLRAQDASAHPPLRALVVTGGHGYDKPEFDAMFTTCKGLSVRFVEHPKAYDEFAADRRGQFDVVVLYDLMQEIKDKQKQDFVEMLKEGKGLVVVHHAIANFSNWDEYAKIIGVKYWINPRPEGATAGRPDRSIYREDVRIRVKIADKEHPITRGLEDFEIIDEVYKYFDVKPGIHVLLGTDHPENEPVLAWTKEYGASRVVYLQFGHDSTAFKNPNFREVLARSMRWAARRPDDQVATPGFKLCTEKPRYEEGHDWVRLFNGKDFDGWEIMGDKAGWQVTSDGVIRSEGGKGGNWLRYAKREFSDFLLRAEWRVSKDGNSGLFIRATQEGNPWDTGLEVPITSAPRDERHSSGSLYVNPHGSVKVRPRPDVWHEFEVRARGRHISVIVDGIMVVKADSKNNEALRKRPLKGFVGIQDSHTDAGKWVEWRNIRIRPLK